MDIMPILKSWPKVECVKFAVWCARRVVHLHPCTLVVSTIKAAEIWLDEPSDDNAALILSRAHLSVSTAGTNIQACVVHASRCAAYSASEDLSIAQQYASGAASYASVALGETSRSDLLNIYMAEQILDAVNS